VPDDGHDDDEENPGSTVGSGETASASVPMLLPRSMTDAASVPMDDLEKPLMLLMSVPSDLSVPLLAAFLSALERRGYISMPGVMTGGAVGAVGDSAAAAAGGDEATVVAAIRPA